MMVDVLDCAFVKRIFLIHVAVQFSQNGGELFTLGLGRKSSDHLVTIFLV